MNNDDLTEFNNLVGCARTLTLYLTLVALTFGAFFWWAGW